MSPLKWERLAPEEIQIVVGNEFCPRESDFPIVLRPGLRRLGVTMRFDTRSFVVTSQHILRLWIIGIAASQTATTLKEIEFSTTQVPAEISYLGRSRHLGVMLSELKFTSITFDARVSLFFSRTLPFFPAFTSLHFRRVLSMVSWERFFSIACTSRSCLLRFPEVTFTKSFYAYVLGIIRLVSVVIRFEIRIFT